MTKSIKHELLHYLNFLKSIGYEYHESLNFISDETSYIKLPNDLQVLKNSVSHCHLCELSKTRKNIVFGEGNKNSKIMFISDAPGNSENEIGQVFVGRSGELLTKMIENVLNIKRNEIYISNIVKCRPPNNRIPTKSEFDLCKAYLFKQIELVKPEIIVTLGEVAYEYLTQEKIDIMKVRGKSINFFDKVLIPTFHPNFLLRNPSLKKEAYLDMLKIKNLMEKKI